MTSVWNSVLRRLKNGEFSHKAYNRFLDFGYRMSKLNTANVMS